MRAIILAAMMAVLLSLSMGCARMFTAETVATYEVRPDGTKLITYTSNKEQQGLDLDLQETDGRVKGLKIHVDKATTQEAAIAAVLQLNTLILEQLKDAALKAAAAGAGS